MLSFRLALVSVLVLGVYCETAERFMQYIVGRHNDFRQRWYSGKQWQRMEWDSSLAEEADRRMSECRMEDSFYTRGEHYAYYSGGDHFYNVRRTFDEWYNGMNGFDWQNSEGEYYQRDWYQGRSVGCAMKMCSSFYANGQNYQNMWFFGCFYEPREYSESYEYNEFSNDNGDYVNRRFNWNSNGNSMGNGDYYNRGFYMNSDYNNGYGNGDFYSNRGYYMNSDYNNGYGNGDFYSNRGYYMNSDYNNGYGNGDFYSNRGYYMNSDYNNGYGNGDYYYNSRYYWNGNPNNGGYNRGYYMDNYYNNGYGNGDFNYNRGSYMSNDYNNWNGNSDYYYNRGYYNDWNRNGDFYNRGYYMNSDNFDGNSFYNRGSYSDFQNGNGFGNFNNEEMDMENKK